MAYIGKIPATGAFQKCDAITVVNGQAAYTLQVGSANVSPESVNHMIVSLNGVIQAPTTAYTVSGATLTFASNLATGDVIDFIILLGNVLDVGTPTDNTVATAKIQDDAVTLAKMAAGTDGQIITYDASGNPTAVGPGTDGQVLTSTGAGSPPAFETGGGAWNLLETQTASSSSLIEFDTGQITSTYDVYKIIINNVHNSADAAELYAQYSKSASYITSGYRYVVAAYTDTDTDIKAGSTSASAIKITRNGTGTASGENCNFEITLWDPLGTDNAKSISWDGHTFNNDGVFHREIGGGGDNGSQAAIDKIKIYPGSGNIASGGFSIYGLAK
jgi:hypothetical protein